MLKLPDLTKTNCFYFQACGKLGSGSPSKSAPEMIARCRSGEKKFSYVRLLHGSNDSKHLHIDLIRHDFFLGGMKRPKVTATLSDIREVVAEYDGLVFDIGVVAWYRMPVGDVDSTLIFTGPNAVTAQVGHASVQVAGARLAFSGSDFLREVEWDVSGSTLFLSVDAEAGETTIDADYLVELFARTERAVNKFVLGRASYAAAAG